MPCIFNEKITFYTYLFLRLSGNEFAQSIGLPSRHYLHIIMITACCMFLQFAKMDSMAVKMGICPYSGKWEQIEDNMIWLPKTYAIFVTPCLCTSYFLVTLWFCFGDKLRLVIARTVLDSNAVVANARFYHRYFLLLC